MTDDDIDRIEAQATTAAMLQLIAALREARARVLYLEAPGECQSLHKLRAEVQIHSDRAECAEALAESLRQDADRWRALMDCERVCVIGGADLGAPNALIGMDFHRRHPDRDDAPSREMFVAFVDLARVTP
jgi:phytoene dehydrogenase-like protein